MPDYSPHVRAEFLHRSYTAVDGLWFMMTEQVHGYDSALDIDERVWAVMPKIQARRARTLLEVEGNTPAELARCFGLKFHSEGHEFETQISEDGVVFRVRQCHWLKLLEESDREHLADEIGQRICNTEGEVWAREFGGEYDFDLPCRMCAGDDWCEYRFIHKRGGGQ